MQQYVSYSDLLVHDSAHNSAVCAKPSAKTFQFAAVHGSVTVDFCIWLAGLCIKSGNSVGRGITVLENKICKFVLSPVGQNISPTSPVCVYLLLKLHAAQLNKVRGRACVGLGQAHEFAIEYD